MKNNFKRLFGFAASLMFASSTALAVDPCSQTTQLSGGQTINNQNKTGTTSTGYAYEIWRDGNGGSLTLYPKDACFKASWNNAGDYLGRVGKTFNKPAWNNLGGDLVANYAYKKSGNDGGTYSYIGIYGWMDNPQIEYYIVDDWLHDRGNPGGSYIGKNYGTITVDGDDYVVWSGTRTGASKWGNSTFTQIFSIRKTRRQCGTINISEHFRQWNKLGLRLGQIMEAQILAESGGGSGYVDFTYATIETVKEGSTGGNTGGNTTPAQPTEKEEPYKGAIAIPGKLECENYDKGGNGFGYSDTDSKNEGEQYRKDGVDIVKANDGYAVGYTTDEEWLKYTINVEESATFNVGAYMANGNADPKISLLVDGKKVTTLTGKGAGDWDTYSMAKGTISLSKGEHTLKINFDNDYTNIDYIVFSKDAIESPNTGGSTGDETGGNTGGTTGGEVTGVNPCGTFSSMGSGQKAQNGGTHNIAGGFNYEMWTNSGNNASMEYYAEKGKFQFKANWNNPDDLLCRIGLYWGTGPKPSELEKDLQCDFNYDFTGTGGGYNYIGIYGWTKTPNEVEYYIVENTFFGNTRKQEGLYYGANKVSSYTIADEGTYDLYIGTRTDAPSISGKSTFKQVFAVRTTPRKCGHISISEHMRKWTQHVTLGQLYDCKFLCEVGAGSGSFDMKYGNVWMGDKVYSTAPAKPTETEEPYKGVIAIPGTIECENYDKGGNGFGYYDTDDTNEGKEYRKDGVDIVAANDGYAVGYTAADEWLKYTVDVASAGEYDVEAYMANGSTDPKITILVDGKKGCSLTGKGVSEDWDTYSIAKGKITLAKGEHTIKVNFDNDYTNIDYIKFIDPNMTDVENVNASAIVIAPNPASDEIVVFAEDLESVRIVDMLGRTVVVSTESTVNVSNLPTGTYAVVVKTADKEVVKKINVMK